MQLVCPDCGEAVPLEDALLHPHFTKGREKVAP